MLFVHIGQAGIQIGHDSWQRMLHEHSIDSQGGIIDNDTANQSEKGAANHKCIFEEV